MKIDTSYQGAIATRSKDQSPLYSTRPNVLTGKEFEFTRLGKDSVMVEFSNEMIEFKNDAADFFLKDINVQNADPSDVFSYRPQDQWLIFSQYLNDAEFFDSTDEAEVNKLESALQQVTGGLDSLTRTGINFFGGVKNQLDSFEAQLELVSSTYALQLFSEKNLSGDVKKGFDQLIKQYTEHNERKVNGYQSLEEGFFEARSKISPIQASVTLKQKEMLSLTNKLGQTTYSKAEITDQLNKYDNIFSGIKEKDDLSDALLETKKLLLKYVTKGISENDAAHQPARNYIEERSSDTFIRIEAYWTTLLI